MVWRLVSGNGHPNERLLERKLAQELDPLSLIVNFEVGLAFYYARDYDRHPTVPKGSGVGPKFSARSAIPGRLL